MTIDELTVLIRKWSLERSLYTADPTKQALKLGEEFGELFEGLAKGDEELTKDALGDMYVVMTILAQQLGFNLEECIEIAYNEIKDRKGKMIDGVFVKESDLKEDE
ncbi:MazG-like family protein [Virgibacillus pantothenticus]|uniref:MazG-like family protein n=1 Tax=Virgibacillus pantothenticus TaxID=1473 RepID=UPI0009861D80|nr:MazG-like family protein [Virgibacillus pantothenticus]